MGGKTKPVQIHVRKSKPSILNPSESQKRTLPRAPQLNSGGDENPLYGFFNNSAKQLLGAPFATVLNKMRLFKPKLEMCETEDQKRDALLNFIFSIADNV